MFTLHTVSISASGPASPYHLVVRRFQFCQRYRLTAGADWSHGSGGRFAARAAYDAGFALSTSQSAYLPRCATLRRLWINGCVCARPQCSCVVNRGKDIANCTDKAVHTIVALKNCAYATLCTLINVLLLHKPHVSCYTIARISVSTEGQMCKKK